MAYKKYIKRNGKLYGPYIYESKRVGGKVVSEYHGHKTEVNIKKFGVLFISAALIIGIVYFLSYVDFGSLTGKAVLSTKTDYAQNQPVRGNMTILLRQGELLPADSKLVLENVGQSYEYNLGSFVSNNVTSGDFYIKGISISGSGRGFGIEGEIKTFPNVSFILEILSGNNTAIQNNESKNQTQSAITTPNAKNDSVINNQTQPEMNLSNSTLINNQSESTVNLSNNTLVNNQTRPEMNLSNNTNNSIVVPQENVTSEPAAPNVSSENASQTSPITGFFIRIYGFFLGLTPTGFFISENQSLKEVNGIASSGVPFTYSLQDGEIARLKPGSVSASGLTIPDDNVKINLNGNQVSVETAYSEMKRGFGSEFLGNKTETINLDFSSLGLVLNDGELKTRIIHGSQEIISTKLTLIPGIAESTSEIVLNGTEINVTIQQNTTIMNSTLQVITPQTVSLVLTDGEKTDLSREFGDVSVAKTKSEILNGRLIIKYEFGDQWIEFSYDASLPQQELDYQMSVDRMKWMKDLAKRIADKKAQARQASQPVENFSI